MKITGNSDVDCILWPKQQRAEEKGIGFNVIGFLPKTMDFLDNFDIVTILGNGLANAIDACEKIETGERFINIVVRLDKHLNIRIDNTFVEAPVPKKTGWFKSSKKDPGHGLGMESIEETVKRYDGHVYTVIEDGVFSLRIMLQQISPSEGDST
jgi:sensor histidine kinase regulating citrate/malate metabolism